jgi:polysaccharide pyruvyl transferase WcaK-like protein
MRRDRRLIVGLGVMNFGGMYSVEKLTNAAYAKYMETLVTFADWLLRRQYDIRLLIGDLMDEPAIQKFKSFLKERLGPDAERRVTDEPVTSVQDLLAQLAATEFVVATRFHNILLPFLLNKPVLGISFHHKCSSLMEEMGMSEYCQDLNHLNAERLIEQFCNLEKNADRLKALIKQKTEEFRSALENQYRLIVSELSV